jgi:hypothetical protein
MVSPAVAVFIAVSNADELLTTTVLAMNLTLFRISAYREVFDGCFYYSAIITDRANNGDIRPM